jgi:hypothetical protein
MAPNHFCRASVMFAISGELFYRIRWEVSISRMQSILEKAGGCFPVAAEWACISNDIPLYDEILRPVAPAAIPTGRRKAETMGEWIPFAEGRYRVERAVLLAADYTGIEVEDAVLEILEDSRGRRRMRGRGRVWNALLVELLDGGEELDLLLDLGGEFKYRLRHPDIHGGKVFTPGVQSFIQFLPRQPWKALSEPDFTFLMSRIRILSDGSS